MVNFKSTHRFRLVELTQRVFLIPAHWILNTSKYSLNVRQLFVYVYFFLRVDKHISQLSNPCRNLIKKAHTQQEIIIQVSSSEYHSDERLIRRSQYSHKSTYNCCKLPILYDKSSPYFRHSLSTIYIFPRGYFTNTFGPSQNAFDIALQCRVTFSISYSF